MKRILISAALVFSLFSFQNCKEKLETKVLTKEVAFTKEGELRLKKAATDSVIVSLNIEIADDAYQTETGLMYRNSMLANEAMLFVFEDEVTRSFYMKNTEFPLDIIFINAKKEIVSIQKNAQPFDPTSLPSDAPSKYVLEVNAGLSNQWQLENGDKIEFEKK